jgi:hypothetical protein
MRRRRRYGVRIRLTMQFMPRFEIVVGIELEPP